MKYALYIGRWQPFHNGHHHIIKKAIDQNKNVLIAIRDTPISEFDPYSVEERKIMIEKTYHGQNVKVISIPDIESINIGREVGYEVNRYDVPDNIAGISATEIRKAMKNKDNSWKEKVPNAVAEYLSKSGKVIWMTGLSGSGKSTIAKELAKRLEKIGKKVKILDGDEVRTHLTSDLGFSKEDRNENIKRISYAAKIICDIDGIAIVAAISPYEEARQKAKELIGDNFCLVHIDADIQTVIERDTKGLYKKALNGEINNFTGISDPYELPKNPDIKIKTDEMNLNQCVNTIMEKIW